MKLHYSGKRIPSPRVDSKALTEIRGGDPSRLKGGLRLQRGGFWQGVNAAKAWSEHRRKLMWTFGETVESVEAASGVLCEIETEGVKEAAGRLGKNGKAFAALASDLVTGLDSHHLLAYGVPSDPDAVAPSELVEKYDEAAEKLLEQHKVLVTEVRKRISAFARKGGCDEKVGALRAAVKKHADAVKILDRKVRPVVRSVLRGVHRMFRCRRDMERGAGPALTFYEGCRIQDGELVLPGGIGLRLPCGEDGRPFVVPPGMKWSGGVHIVDMTDRAGKVTRRTRPRHRKYKVHLICKSYAPAPEEPEGPAHTLGVDWGIVNPLVDSDGRVYPKYATEQQGRDNYRRHQQSQQLQRSMSAKTPGSRRHRKQNRQRGKLIEKNVNVKINQQLHNAKAATTKPGIRCLTVERTKAKNLGAGAVGSKAHPARSAGKRGLNRSLAETAPARKLGFIARASVVNSVGIHQVDPAYTSLTCFVCGAVGQRETQALFHCPSCGNLVHADVQAALNVEERGHPNLHPPAGGGRDSRRKTLNDAMEVFTDHYAPRASRTNTPVNPGI